MTAKRCEHHWGHAVYDGYRIRQYCIKCGLIQAQNDEALLRRLAAEVLQPKPWEHASEFTAMCDRGGPVCGAGPDTCLKCGKVGSLSDACAVPDPDTRPLPVIVSELLKKCNPGALQDIVLVLSDLLSPVIGITKSEVLPWWIFAASDIDQLLCCLVALGKVSVESKPDQSPCRPRMKRTDLPDFDMNTDVESAL